MPQLISHPWKNGGDDPKLPVVMTLDNGHVLIVADADTDADGSPDAKIIDPKYGDTQSALGSDNGWKGKGPYVDAKAIPYFVLPMNWREVTGIKCKLGDVAKLTYKGKSVFAIYADTGPNSIIGEASVAAVVALGINPWNAEGQIVRGIDHGVSYEIIPGSADLSITRTFETIQSYGMSLFGEPPASVIPGFFKDIRRIELGKTKEGVPTFIAHGKEGPMFGMQFKSTLNLMTFLEAMPNAEVDPSGATWPAAQLQDIVGNVLTPAGSTNAFRFMNFFDVYYDLVREEVERWFAPMNEGSAVHNGCVAHQVSCLKLCNLPCPDLGTMESINVDYFVNWAISQGWTMVHNRNAMEPGDICVSGPSAQPKEIDHVYCFVSYLNSDYAEVLHNQARGRAMRSLDGVGCGVWRYAMRMPD